ncbi:hypothetical protein ABZP36_017683 [Zizania latifolia]
MDPIMKLLEDDEDETMHSGAEVEAFTAALNREVEGSASVSSSGAVSSQPLDHGVGESLSPMNLGHDFPSLDRIRGVQYSCGKPGAVGNRNQRNSRAVEEL